MSTFFEHHRDRLAAFARVSGMIGARADYVQGGGGNTSVKLEGGLMAIKASGYCLKDIAPDRAYAVLDCASLREFYFGAQPSDFDDVEKAGSDRAKASVQQIDGLAPLRPSVEAGFHSLLDTYVAHSHSVYANLATCAADGREVVARALADADYTWGFVPYTDPGARLTFSIRDELARVESETGRRPAVIFMQNHGQIAHHDDPDECQRIHADVNRRVAEAFGVRDGDFPAVSVREIGGGLVEADSPLLSDALRSGAYSEKFLLESPLYPDQLVFLTGSFAFGSAPADGMCAADPATGRVCFAMPVAKAQVIAETLTCVVYICETLKRSGHPLSTMDEAARAFIANWESEKYRKSLAGKK